MKKKIGVLLSVIFSSSVSFAMPQGSIKSIYNAMDSSTNIIILMSSIFFVIFVSKFFKYKKNNTDDNLEKYNSFKNILLILFGVELIVLLMILFIYFITIVEITVK